MKTKSRPVTLKAASEHDGTFEALVSVFGNVDYAGDRVMPGAFRNSLEQWRASGNSLPVIWSHRWDDPHAHIGKVTDARETADGLLVKGQLDLDRPFAEQVHHLLRERRVTEFSFGYAVVREKRAPDGANELHEIDLWEVGPTLKGMNPATQLVGAKGHPTPTTAGTGPAALAGHLALAAGDIPTVDQLRAMAKAAGPDLTPTGVALLATILELELDPPAAP